ncbi:MAG TPA: DNA polymerase III subunit beta [Gemmataceae bacterium]|jgi:DNA polymerase-3 subunit beta|nr:DNA polymerase III subunit beta [Gemmataceae bacterium]
MKVRSHREGLLSAFQLAGVAVPSRDLKPVLKNIKVIADGDRCTLLATDLELGIRLEVRGLHVEEPGEALLPSNRMLAILRESTDDEIAIEADAQTCMVRGQSNEFEMGGEDPAEFPDVPAFSSDSFHELPAGMLREMIRRTVFAAATENPRYALTGILWELEGPKVRLVATDGRRLAMMEGAAVSQGGHDTKGQTHVVPTKAMQLLERNLADPEEQVRVCLRPNDALFKTERAMIYSRLVEGRYPPYREVFPKKQTVKVPLVTGPFHAAVRQAAIMTDEETKKVVFTFEKKKLIMQAHGPTTGRSKVEMAVDYDGKQIKIGFDPKFITEMLRVLNADDQLSLELIDGNSVALFRCGENYSYIVMPLS